MMDMLEFLNEFQLEAGEKLDIMASQLLRLERDATNPAPVREMFLAAHTIKGGAAMLRLTDVEALAHAVEDLLSTFRDNVRTLEPATADLLFQSIDHLRALVGAASADSVGAEPDPAIERFAARLRGAPTAAEPIPEPQPSGTRRALVVDDSATVRLLHRAILEDAGYEVATYEDGQAARQAAMTEAFAIVVSGLLMKGLGGLELCVALRARGVPVVLVSADADPDMARRATEAGAHTLIRKGSVHDAHLAEALTLLA